jgi:large subunit ribosomal protein L21
VGIIEMYAVIATGGKQYKVAPGDVIKIEKLSVEPGKSVEFPVLLAASSAATVAIGQPFLPDIRVKASVVAHGRREKIQIVKFRRRKHHRKQIGHRQHYTAIKIMDIVEK